jgi:cell wall-associated NlpC family hydrolase
MSNAMAILPLSGLLQVPFVDGGRDTSGMDCYGLVRYVFAVYGMDLPDYPIHPDAIAEIDATIEREADNGWEIVVPPTPDADEVPLLVAIEQFGAVSHVAAYIGNGQIVHTRRSTGVTIEPVARWRKRIVGYYRYIGSGA